MILLMKSPVKIKKIGKDYSHSIGCPGWPSESRVIENEDQIMVVIIIIIIILIIIIIMGH